VLPINEIIQGDCLEVMQSFPGDSIDLTVTSPPYDNLRTYKGYTFNFEGIAKELYRVTKQGGVVVWVVGDATVNGSETLNSFKQAIYYKEVCGFNVHDTMIYEKDGTSFPDDNRYYQVFEYMFVLSKGTPKTINLIKDRVNRYAGKPYTSTSRDKNGNIADSHGKKHNKTHTDFGVRRNVWGINRGFNKSTKDKEAYEHPAIFPERLAEDHIKSWSNQGDIIFDPMCGSGTTCKMAVANNRQYIGIDISEKYCKIARERVKRAESKKKLFYV